MVIYLYKRKEVVLKIFIFFFIMLFIYSLSYFISYIKYDNRKYVDSNLLLIENKILKEEISSIKDIDYEYGKIVKVIYRDIYSFYDELVINKGKESIKVNDALINEDGLVGIVYKVDNNKSLVKLVSSNYNISVKVNDTYGILSKGIITMIDKYSDVKIGDKVYTSGLDDVIGGIYVGEVISVSLDNDGLGKEVKIKYVNNDNLNYVGILRKIK